MTDTAVLLKASPDVIGYIVQLNAAFQLPAEMTTEALMAFWHCSQPTVSRRLSAIDDSGLAMVSRVRLSTYRIEPIHLLVVA